VKKILHEESVSFCSRKSEGGREDSIVSKRKKHYLRGRRPSKGTRGEPICGPLRSPLKKPISKNLKKKKKKGRKIYILWGDRERGEYPVGNGRFPGELQRKKGGSFFRKKEFSACRSRNADFAGRRSRSRKEGEGRSASKGGNCLYYLEGAIRGLDPL